MLKSVILEVVGDQRLFCDGCERRVERLLKALQGVGQVRARRCIGELANKGLIRAERCAGSRKRRYVFLWHPIYETPRSVPKKAPGRVRDSSGDPLARLRRSFGP